MSKKLKSERHTDCVHPERPLHIEDAEGDRGWGRSSISERRMDGTGRDDSIWYLMGSCFNWTDQVTHLSVCSRLIYRRYEAVILISSREVMDMDASVLRVQ